MNIGLDLAMRNCGIAVMDGEKLLSHYSYETKTKGYLELQIEMVTWILKTIKPYGGFTGNRIILEQVYTGVNPAASINTARIHGGVIQKMYEETGKFPVMPLATTARRYLGLETWLSKAELQMWVIDKFKLGTVNEEVRGEMMRADRHWTLNTKRLGDKKKYTKDKWIKAEITKEINKLNKDTKNTFNRMSTQIIKQTGITSHAADSIVLAMYEGE